MILPLHALNTEIVGFRVVSIAQQYTVYCRCSQPIEMMWWRRLDSNQRPRDYETLALAT
jgi:hypothetical protein